MSCVNPNVNRKSFSNFFIVCTEKVQANSWEKIKVFQKENKVRKKSLVIFMEKVEGYTNTSLVFALCNCLEEVQWVMFIK